MPTADTPDPRPVSPPSECTCPVEWTGINAPLRGHAPGCPTSIGIAGEIVESHMEGDIRVIDKLNVTGAAVSPPSELTAEDIQNVIREAQHQYGQLAKVPLSFYDALLDSIRADAARAAPQADAGTLPWASRRSLRRRGRALRV